MKTGPIIVQLVDELVRIGWSHPILIIDSGPSPTLHYHLLNLDTSPSKTVSAVMENLDFSVRAVRGLTKPLQQHVAETLLAQNIITHHEVHGHQIYYMAMGRSYIPGYYCAVNNSLAQILLWRVFSMI